jgi:hypothetical protein
VNNNAMQIPISYLKANYRVIEQDLYNYYLIKQHVKKIIEEYKISEEYQPTPSVSTNRPIDEGGRPKGKTSDSTYNQAVKCMRLRERYKNATSIYSALGFAEMMRRIEAIEYVLDRLESSSIGADKLKADLVKKRYFERRLTPDGLAIELHIHRSTVFKWCNDVIGEIATRLGFIV